MHRSQTTQSLSRDSQNNPPLEKLARLIKIRTESFTDYNKFDMKEFNRFRSELNSLYPAAFETMTEIDAGSLALLFYWEGRDTDLKPLLFISHWDVVGAEEEKWKHPPFGGVIEDDYLYGRGTMDIKSQLGAYMESLEILIKEGFVPERSIYFAFGGDEEVAGLKGAGRMSAWFETQGISFEYLMDEGGIISTDGMKAFTPKPAALIGIAEKGMMSLKLSCQQKSGHSSMPPRHTAIGCLAGAVKILEDNPFPARLDNSILRLLKTLAPWCRAPLGWVFKLLPLSGGIVKGAFSKSDSTNSLIRTSQAVTMIKGGTRENVLPSSASVIVNFRILPGDSISGVKKRIEKLLRGRNIEVELNDEWPANEPLPAPENETPAFKLIKNTVEEIFPGVITLPFLVNGSTDSKYYRNVTENIFRFTPMFLSSSDLECIHGVDERISRESYGEMIRFYTELIKKS